MGELYTSIEIQAPAEYVWRLLTDFDCYSKWNPFLVYVHGEIKVGARIEVCARPSGSIGRTFYPIIRKVESNRELRWLGRLPIPGLLDGEHIFIIEEIDSNNVRFIHREHFSGLLVLFHKMVRFKHTKRGFEEMNQVLKRLAEKIK